MVFGFKGLGHLRHLELEVRLGGVWIRTGIANTAGY